VYKFPEKYIFVKFKNKEHVHLGINASLGMYRVDFEELVDDNNTRFFYYFGFEPRFVYSKYVSLNLPLSYLAFNEKNNSFDFKMRAIQLSPTVYINFFNWKLIEFSAGISGGLHYNLGSYFFYDEHHVKLKPLAFGYGISINALYNNKIALGARFMDFKFNSEQLLLTDIDRAGTSGKYKPLSISLTYFFK
jgi:hypothetical protein